MLVGCFVGVGMFLFPPYQATFLKSGDNPTAFAGYDFIFSPPTKLEVYFAVYGGPFSGQTINDPLVYPQNYVARIDRDRWFAGFGLCLVVTVALFIFFKSP